MATTLLNRILKTHTEKCVAGNFPERAASQAVIYGSNECDLPVQPGIMALGAMLPA